MKKTLCFSRIMYLSLTYFRVFKMPPICVILNLCSEIGLSYKFIQLCFLRAVVHFLV